MARDALGDVGVWHLKVVVQRRPPSIHLETAIEPLIPNDIWRFISGHARGQPGDVIGATGNIGQELDGRIGMHVHVFLRDLLGDCGMRRMLLGPVIDLKVDNDFTRNIAILRQGRTEGCEEKREDK